MTNFFAVSTLRQLSALEVHNLYKLRVDVFVHEQRSPYAEIDEIDALDSTLHIQAFDATTTLRGTARLYQSPEGTLHIGRLCVDAEYRNQGLGAAIMQQALGLADALSPSSDIVLDAQEHLVGFYERFGFTADGDAFMWDGVAHVPMRRTATLAKSV